MILKNRKVNGGRILRKPRIRPALVGSLSVVPHLIAETLSHPFFPVKNWPAELPGFHSRRVWNASGYILKTTPTLVFWKRHILRYITHCQLSLSFFFVTRYICSNELLVLFQHVACVLSLVASVPAYIILEKCPLYCVRSSVTINFASFQNFFMFHFAAMEEHKPCRNLRSLQHLFLLVALLAVMSTVNSEVLAVGGMSLYWPWFWSCGKGHTCFALTISSWEHCGSVVGLRESKWSSVSTGYHWRRFLYSIEESLF